MGDKGVVLALHENFTILVEYDGSGNPVYLGEGVPGTATSDAAWRIRKVTWLAGNAVSIKWAEGTTLFDKVWDSRATYTYS